MSQSFKKDIKGDSGLNSNNGFSSINNNNNNININNNKTLQSSNMKKSGSRNRSGANYSKRNNTKNSNRSKTSYVNNRQQLVDDSPDIMSIIKSSKKGMDISHLITYNYANDDEYDDSGRRMNDNRSRPKSNYKNKKKSSSSNIHLTGLTYINANYKFLLNYQGDYKPQLLDPNLPLNPNDISRVIVKQHDYHCPICLADDFVAPRMTKCGHIFCYHCLLSMFDNVRNDKKKTSIGNMHNPSISCPLCSEIITEKSILLPVLVEPTTDKDSKVESKSSISLSLMYRGNSKIYSQKISNFYQFKGFNGSIPWISENCTPLNYKQYSPYISNTRLLMSDYNFTKSCYRKEIDDLLTQKLLDLELYGDSGKFYDIAVSNIRKNIETLDNIIESSPDSIKLGPKQIDQYSLGNQLSNLSLEDSTNITLPSFKDGYYYYQYNANSRIHYFLSPLDVVVINTLFKIPSSKDAEEGKFVGNPAYNLPLTLNVFLENINSDESKVTPELVTKYPFLGNLPYGAEIAFLEIDWSKFDASSIPIDDIDEEQVGKDKYTAKHNKYPIQLPPNLSKRLQNRTRDINNKRIYEEKARVRGEIRREQETLEIFNPDALNKQNDENDDDFIDAFTSNNRWNKNQFVHIDNIDNMPTLKGVSNSFSVLTTDSEDNNDANTLGTEGSISKSNYTMSTKKSVWGTNVPVVITPEEQALRDQEDALRAAETREFEELLRKAKDEANESKTGKGKKGKKGKRVKMVPLPL